MSTNLKIGYFADGPWGQLAFEKIVQDSSIEIVFICVRFKKKDPVLIEAGRKHNIDVICSQNINSREFLDKLNSYHADLFVSMSFDQIFHDEIRQIPSLKIINCHAGKLPYYRGRNILNWALINDEKEFGITVHYVDSGIDTGDIILQRTFPICDQDDYGTLLQRAYIGCADILYDAVKIIQAGDVQPIPQAIIDPIGTYCGIRQDGDEIINWNQTSRDIFNFVRALCPPGPCAISYVNDIPVKLKKVRMVPGAHIYKGIPGQIIGKSPDGYFVKTANTMLELIDYESAIALKIGMRLK